MAGNICMAAILTMAGVVVQAWQDSSAGGGECKIDEDSQTPQIDPYEVDKIKATFSRGGECKIDEKSQHVVSFLQTKLQVKQTTPQIDLYEVDKIKATFSPSVGTYLVSQPSAASAPSATEKCFNASSWLEKFANEPSWHKYSQGDQDAVLSSLFSAHHLGTTDKNFVEFGFPDHDFRTSYGNGKFLKRHRGFNNYLLLDGSGSNDRINKQQRFVAADTIVGIFDEFNVPKEADYVSVDIDSCDLWQFFAVTKKYRPRVMTVEYNSNYALGDYSTLRCAAPREPGAYAWEHDNIYGASLSAIELAAQVRGYSLVYVTPKLDAFLVRSDLLCKGSAVPKESFSTATNLQIHGEYSGKYGPKSELVVDFRSWLAKQVDH